MKKLFVVLFALILFCSHDMFLKLDTYFIAPNTNSQIKLFNGTFDRSDNVITRDRMIDVSLVGNGTRQRVDSSQWIEEDGATLLNFTTGNAGTWVAGVSTHPRDFEQTAEKFNAYLEHDGVTDMLDWRKVNNALDQDATERYSKHVKTIFQVGDQLTQDWQTVLGYPIEFVPLSNPYESHSGHAMKFRLLWQGKPLARQLVYAGHRVSGEEGHDHDHDHDHAHEEGDDHRHDEGIKVRTDANGEFSVDIDHGGIWYLRTIYMAFSQEEGLTHESNWATLTFEVGEGDHDHDHDHASHSHDHDHDHDHEEDFHIPEYVFWVGSFLLIFLLFLYFNRKDK
ncbi:MAG: DUF4198 domain-containing protein [Bacteroidota bacterium]